MVGPRRHADIDGVLRTVSWKPDILTVIQLLLFKSFETKLAIINLNFSSNQPAHVHLMVSFTGMHKQITSSPRAGLLSFMSKPTHHSTNKNI